MAPPDDSAKARRELRVRIGRQRRRIDRRYRYLEREGRKLVSWRTYLVRYPTGALALVGAGVTGVLSVQRGRWPRRLSLPLFQRVGAILVQRLLNILETAKAPRGEYPLKPSIDGGEFGGT